MTTATLRRLRPSEIESALRQPVDAETLRQAGAIVEDVRMDGESALRRYAEQFGERQPGEQLVLERDDLEAALADLPQEQSALLARAGERIGAFAQAQRDALKDVVAPIPGGQVGHTVEPVAIAGCYAPGGRFPLPSSVLMTAVTARIAGVQSVTVASPKPAPATLAAAAIAGADRLLAIGGAHAIAALAYGAGVVQRCDVIVGPGNKWVTAAKQIVSGSVGIDMLAGPSELAIIADDSADADTIAADLLAQAEHDTEAMPILITPSTALIDRVEEALANQLEKLPTADIARQALGNGFAVLVGDLDEAAAVSDRIAPEHLELLVEDPPGLAIRIRSAGALFLGASAAEVLGDYGAGPNHTLPTGGAARFCAGLSVFDFLRVRTWLRIDDRAKARPLIEDAAAFARIEGLEAHARSAERRL